MYGELGLGLISNPDSVFIINTPTQISGIKAKAVSCGYSHTIIIDLNNNVWAFGQNHRGQLGLGDNQNRNIPVQIPDIKAKAVSCGEHHTMIIDLNNNVWAFGYNHVGQLGLGDT